jgi:hypothetical protein
MDACRIMHAWRMIGESLASPIASIRPSGVQCMDALQQDLALFGSGPAAAAWRDLALDQLLRIREDSTAIY